MSSHRAFQLSSAGRYIVAGKDITFEGALIITPEPTEISKILSAWTYALRYSAKGLNYPDYEAALKLLLERHPSWQHVDIKALTITPDFEKAAEDIPET